MLEQRLIQGQKQQLILSPQLQQAIRILQLPVMELKTVIEQELENNPCLETTEVNFESPPTSETSLPEERGKTHYNNDNGEDYFSSLSQSRLAKEVSLEEALLSQMRVNFDKEEDLRIGELIIGSLNENGYLKISVDEIAQMANTEVKIVEKVLEKIQNFEPLGCGSRDIKECLLVQLKAKGREGSLAYRIVESYIDALANKRYILLSKKLAVGLEEVKLAVKEIGLLEPKPARQFSYIDKSMYVVPDIIVEKDKDSGEFKVITNDSELPILRISRFYKSLLNKKNISGEEKDFIRNRLQSGQDFIKSIKMRKETIKRLTEYIVEVQQEFLEKGKEYIKPLTFRQVAEHIKRDESTVSRTVNNKYIQTPQGIFRLKSLFSVSVKRTNDGEPDTESVSSASVKERIRNLVEDEDKTKPLSDEDILKQLQSTGLKLSRRTIAKYRKQLKILPSYLRKE